MRLLSILFTIFVLTGGCSKNSSSSAGSGSAGAGPASAPAASKPAAAPAGANCAACEKFDQCCAALAAIKDSGVDSSSCDGRAQFCVSMGPGQVQDDTNQTCVDRVTKWQKSHPDVAACK